jgi:hypothetical protein
MIDRAVASVDRDGLSARKSALDAERLQIDQAIAQAEARIASLAGELAAEAPASSVAQALLAGDSAGDAVALAPNRARLVEEREVLIEALRELRAKAEANRYASGELANEARGAIGEATKPALAELLALAKAEAAALVGTLGAIHALSWATGCHVTERSGVARIAAGLMAGGLVTVDGLAIAPDARAAVQPLAALPCIGAAIPDRIEPASGPNIGLIAGLVASQR